jgi:hypothetical protein
MNGAPTDSPASTKPGAEQSPRLGLFEGYGVEVEYMIVDRDGLGVAPISDELIKSVAGCYESEVEMGELSWSNELVLHVIELKTNGPAAALEPLPRLFARDVTRIDRLLAARGARLMPTAMHPLMDPARETRLWPHEYSEVYESFDRIFSCQGHGWSNLQSVHINLPFSGDEEFGHLHAAIRLVLPILPMLAASSPIVEGRATGLCDNRLEYYRQNCRRVPSVTGHVIPEPAFTRADYERGILDVISRDIAPLDNEGVLEAEWVNARGAIARFVRDSIEIRVLDVQECPIADLAVVAEERWASGEVQRGFAVERLEAILLEGVRHGGRAVVDDPQYLAALGLDAGRLTGSELWQRLLQRLLGEGLLGDLEQWRMPLDLMTRQGTLAERIVRAAGPEPARERILEIYEQLCDCLAQDRLFSL